MDLDTTGIFEKYEALVHEVDKVVEAVKSQYPEEVACKKGCADCCHAVFDLSLIEAMYINKKFNELFSGMERSDILDRADESEREMYKAKREANKEVMEGKDVNEVLEELGRLRIRCPLLSEDDLCLMYENRPVTCRLYGLPLNIGGKAVTCGMSGFKEGGKYPAVNMDRINERLAALAEEFVDSLDTENTKMADILVPLGMALMNHYDRQYLGVKDNSGKAAQSGPGPVSRTVRGAGR